VLPEQCLDQCGPSSPAAFANWLRGHSLPPIGKALLVQDFLTTQAIRLPRTGAMMVI
jgi:hypothetical protein